MNNKIYKGVIHKSNKRIIVIGDIHGDLDLLLDSLIIGNLIQEVQDSDNDVIELYYKNTKKKYFKWVGEKTLVVQVGDQVDRCRPSDLPCNHKDATVDDEGSDLLILKFMTDLNQVAKKYGGAVYNLLGNHEIMNVRGLENDYDYVSHEGLLQFTPKNEEVDKRWRKEGFKRGGIISNYLAKNRLTILILNNYLFAHAGLIDTIFQNKYFKHLEPNDIIDKINKEVICWLKFPNYNTKRLNFILNNLESPLWVRKLGNIPPNISMTDDKCSPLKEIIDRFKLKGMVIGHTPQIVHFINDSNKKDNIVINGTCNNKLFRVDVAASKAFNKVISDSKDHLRKPQVLEILGNKFNVLI